MVRNAFKLASLELEIKIAPWKRCLAAAKRGEIDSVFAVSHSDERSTFLRFPENAANMGVVEQSFGEPSLVIVTRTGPEFDDVTDKGVAPEPIGVPRGHSSVERNRDENRKIVVGSRYLDLFEMLKRGRVNSLVMPSRMVDLYCSLAEYQNIFKKMRNLERLARCISPFQKLDPYLMNKRTRFGPL